MDLLFVFNSILLGVGLAMDAFSVSVANGLSDTGMKKSKMSAIAGTFSFFQFAMPLIGWFIVHKAVGIFGALNRFIPYISLFLLLYIGTKMIIDSIKESKIRKACAGCDKAKCDRDCAHFERTDGRLDLKTLFVQGIATSIDALSVGFATSGYKAAKALICSLIIGAVTFVICYIGVAAGTKLGKYLSRAGIVGGLILIAIGIEIFIKGIL